MVISGIIPDLYLTVGKRRLDKDHAAALGNLRRGPAQADQLRTVLHFIKCKSPSDPHCCDCEDRRSRRHADAKPRTSRFILTVLEALRRHRPGTLGGPASNAVTRPLFRQWKPELNLSARDRRATAIPTIAPRLRDVRQTAAPAVGAAPSFRRHPGPRVAVPVAAAPDEPTP